MIFLLVRWLLTNHRVLLIDSMNTKLTILPKTELYKLQEDNAHSERSRRGL